MAPVEERARDAQLQRPLLPDASLEPVAVERKPATDEMLMTRPGSYGVASFASISVNLHARGLVSGVTQRLAVGAYAAVTAANGLA